LLELRKLVVAQRPGRKDFGYRLTPMFGEKAAEGFHDRAQLVLASVPSEYAKEIAGDWIEVQLRGDRGESLVRLFPRDERALHQLREILGIDQCLIQRFEAAADGIDLPLISCQIE